MSTPTMTLWIPKDLDPASKTMDIAETMIRDFGVSQINNDTYNNDFKEYYDQHIRENEKSNNTFCARHGVGVNISYLIENSNKKSYISLLSLKIDPSDPNNFTVLASIVFKWSPTANSVKIQVFCSNQKITYLHKGSGTKLLNFLKKVLNHMNINNIYLNPIPTAVSYYKSQKFAEAKTPRKKIYDSSSPETKTKSKSKTKSKTSPKSPKPKSATEKMPTMTINLRADRNWKKTKNKIRSYQALTRKKYGKTYEANEKNVLLAKVDKIIDDLGDLRDFAQYQDIIELLEKQEINLNDEEEDIVRRYLEDNYNVY